MGNEDPLFSSSGQDTDDQEGQSPLNQKAGPKHTGISSEEKGIVETGVGKHLFQQERGVLKSGQRKRKSKVADPVSQTPVLDEPLVGPNAIVPVGFVNSGVNQLDTGADSDGSLIETLKRMKRGKSSQNAKLAGATVGSSRRAK